MASIILSHEQIHGFQERVFSFYARYGRTLPWRQTTDPYRILVSEVMLQQTQVSRVIPFYEHWIQTWPAVESLAQASTTGVLKAWMGLGYNRRAINLHRAANVIVQEYHGDVLSAMCEYKRIPGVGEYTARAVLIFSGNEDTVTVDTNIRRILIAEFQLPQTTSNVDLWAIADQCLPRGRSRDWHNALMDYGALSMTARSTGIAPRTRQTSYQGSDRQIRALILKTLLKQPQSDTTLTQQCKIPQERLEAILAKMQKEGLVIIEENKYRVPEQ